METVRRVVDVVGRYAGAYLPGEARQNVRGFILSLPGKWVNWRQGRERAWVGGWVGEGQEAVKDSSSF